ncbi:MAG: outer rane efflux protein [Gemmatimonadetes bacterium]|nr:outer rane efflux protein [Gemmatimonadota bacterium]
MTFIQTTRPTAHTVRVARWLASALMMVLPLAARPVAAQDTTRARVLGDTITLSDAIRIALAQNSSVRFARNNLALDTLSVRSARNAFLPNLAASSSTSQGFGAGSQGQNTLSISGGLSSGVTLYNGRQNVNTLRQAELFARAGGEDLGRTRQAIVFTVASEYLALITQQEQLRVQQQNLAAQEQELVQLQEFTRVGTRPIGDLYQLQAAVAQTRLALVNAQRATEIAKVDLIQELVLDPRRSYVFATPAPRVPTGEARLPTFNLDSLVDVALLQRADLRAQQLRVQAAQREIDIARGGRLPIVSASAGYSSGYNSGADGTFLSQLNQRRGGSIGVGVSVPIFDRGAVSIATQRAQIGLENELLALRDQGQTVALEVRRAYLDYLAAQEQIAAAEAQQRAATLALAAAQARYRVGLATFIEVTLARATLVQAESAIVSSRSSLAFQQALMSYYTGVLDPGNVSIGMP